MFGNQHYLSYSDSIKNLEPEATEYLEWPFEILVFKCPDETCSECLTFNSIENWGICTSCIQNYELVNERCFLLCGDGSKDGAEECDDKNTLSQDGCSSICEIESGYYCSSDFPSICTTKCSDGIVAGAEECDDGNVLNGDECSAECKNTTDISKLQKLSSVATTTGIVV